MKIITLAGNNFAEVDTTDFEKVCRFKWHLNSRGYAVCYDKKTGKKIRMHRLIMDFPDNDIDHKNGNKLDNKRINLRICKHIQNVWNSPKKSTNKSGHKGVSWSKKRKKWIAFITVNYKQMYLGGFSDIAFAADTYKKAARKFYGEFAYE